MAKLDDGEREFFRLEFPAGGRPKLEIDGKKYQVSELSEEGARILYSAKKDIDFPQSFQGTIRYENGESDAVSGSAIRPEGNELVLQLDSGISFSRMLNLQIWLKKKYPLLFDD